MIKITLKSFELQGGIMSILKTINLRKYYGEKPNIVKAIDDINLTVSRNEFLAIVGTSGSGKSTLLNMIGGLDVPTSGKVLIEDMDLSQMEEEELTYFRRKHIGFVFQKFNLVNVLNVRENITFPIDLEDKKMDEKYFEKIISLLDIEGVLTKMPNQLSGGQQQRVAIARALITKPSIILADEPTGNLDHKNSENVVNLLKYTNEQFKQTTIMITHDQNIAQKAHRVLHLEDGRIVGE